MVDNGAAQRLEASSADEGATHPVGAAAIAGAALLAALAAIAMCAVRRHLKVKRLRAAAAGAARAVAVEVDGCAGAHPVTVGAGRAPDSPDHI